MNIPQKLADEFQLRQEQIDNTIALLDDGKTIPFIARYRKERTGSLDDQVLRAIDNRLQYLRKLEQRKSEILSAIESQGKLTPELTEKIQKAETLVETEDLYLPYRPKRKTRASMAIARGLEPLARTLMAQDAGTDPVQAAQASSRKKCRIRMRRSRAQWTSWQRRWRTTPTCANRCAAW